MADSAPDITLIERLKTTQVELSRLQAENDALRRDGEQQRNAAAMEAQALQSKLADAAEIKQKLLEKARSLATHGKELRLQLEESVTTVSKRDVTIAELQAELAASRKDAELRSKEHSELVQRLSVREAQLEGVQVVVAELQTSSALSAEQALQREAEAQSLRADLRVASEEASELRVELADAHTQLQSAHSEAEVLRQRLFSLEHDPRLCDAPQANTTISQGAQGGLALMRSHEQELGALREELARALGDAAHLRSELDAQHAVSVEVEALQTRIATSETCLAAERAAVADLQLKLEGLASSAPSSDALADAQVTALALSARLESSEASLRGAQLRADSAEAAAAELRAQTETTAEVTAALEARLAEIQFALRASDDRIAAMEAGAALKQKELGDALAKIDRAETEVESRRQELQHAEQQFAFEAARVEKLQASLVDTDERLQRETATTAELRALLHSHNSAVPPAEEAPSIEDLRGALQSLHTERDSLVAELATCRSAETLLGDMTAAHAAAQADVSRLTAELETSHRKCERVIAAVSAAKHALVAREAEHERLVAELDGLRRDLSVQKAAADEAAVALTAAHGEARAAAATASAEAAAMRSAFVQVTRERDLLQERLQAAQQEVADTTSRVALAEASREAAAAALLAAQAQLAAAQEEWVRSSEVSAHAAAAALHAAVRDAVAAASTEASAALATAEATWRVALEAERASASTAAAEAASALAAAGSAAAAAAAERDALLVQADKMKGMLMRQQKALRAAQAKAQEAALPPLAWATLIRIRLAEGVSHAAAAAVRGATETDHSAAACESDWCLIARLDEPCRSAVVDAADAPVSDGHAGPSPSHGHPVVRLEWRAASTLWPLASGWVEARCASDDLNSALASLLHAEMGSGTIDGNGHQGLGRFLLDHAAADSHALAPLLLASHTADAPSSGDEISHVSLRPAQLAIRSLLEALHATWSARDAAAAAAVASARADAAAQREDHARYRARAAVAMRKQQQQQQRAPQGGATAAAAALTPRPDTSVALSPVSAVLARPPGVPVGTEEALEEADAARAAAETRVAVLSERLRGAEALLAASAAQITALQRELGAAAERYAADSVARDSQEAARIARGVAAATGAFAAAEAEAARQLAEARTAAAAHASRADALALELAARTEDAEGLSAQIVILRERLRVLTGPAQSSRDHAADAASDTVADQWDGNRLPIAALQPARHAVSSLEAAVESVPAADASLTSVLAPATPEPTAAAAIAPAPPLSPRPQPQQQEGSDGSRVLERLLRLGSGGGGGAPRASHGEATSALGYTTTRMFTDYDVGRTGPAGNGGLLSGADAMGTLTRSSSSAAAASAAAMSQNPGAGESDAARARTLPTGSPGDGDSENQYSLAGFTAETVALLGGDFDPASLRWKLADALTELGESRGLLRLQGVQLESLKGALRETEANAQRMATLGALPAPPSVQAASATLSPQGRASTRRALDASYSSTSVAPDPPSPREAHATTHGTPAETPTQQLSEPDSDASAGVAVTASQSDAVVPSPAGTPAGESPSGSRPPAEARAPPSAPRHDGPPHGDSSSSQNASVQMQYLKNALVAYMLAPGDAERARMLPAIGVLLSLSKDELDRVRVRLRGSRGAALHGSGHDARGAVPVPGLSPAAGDADAGRLSSLWGFLRR